MSHSELPPEWWGDTFKTWAVLDSGRQDDELKRLADKVAAINETIEGPRGLRQDLNSAHGGIRKSKAITWQDVAVMALVAIICIILTLFAATFIPSIHLVR